MYEILKDFKGSQDGRFSEWFKAGQKNVELSDDLAEVAVKEKWARKMKVDKKAEKATAETEQ